MIEVTTIMRAGLRDRSLLYFASCKLIALSADIVNNAIYEHLAGHSGREFRGCLAASKFPAAGQQIPWQAKKIPCFAASGIQPASA
jgi:hypothetical protein